MTYTWQEHEPFHLRYCHGLYCREMRELPVGDAYIPNEYDEPGVLLFGGRNKAFATAEIVRQVSRVAEEVGQPACFYVTPTWEDPQAAGVELAAAGCMLEAGIQWYHRTLNGNPGWHLPDGLYVAKSADEDEFAEAYEAAFGFPGWKPFVDNSSASDVAVRIVYLKDTSGRLVGFGGIAWDGTQGQIHSVGVPERERGKGYGKLIVQQCMEALVALGVCDVVVGILDTNEVSVRLHMGLGFRSFAKAEWWELKA